MGFRHVDSTATQATSAVTTLSATLPLAVSAGDLLVAVIGSNGAGGISDNQGNTWVVGQRDAGNYTALAYCLSSVAAAANTLTVTATSPAGGTMFLAVDRFATTGAVTFGSGSAAGVSGTSGNCGVIGGDAGGNLLYGGLHTDSASVAFTAGQSNGIAATPGVSAGTVGGSGFTEYVLATAAGTQSLTWAASASLGGDGAVQATFSAAVVGTGFAYCGTPATLRLEQLDPSGTVISSLDLMDERNGYRVTTLDVGFPTVRQVVSALPTRDGDYDTTSLYGPRTVTITGSLIGVTGVTRQAALDTLARWCQPRMRPRLVYAVDSGHAALQLGLRGSALTAVHSNPFTTQFSVSWVAPDPVARALSEQQVTIYSPNSATCSNNGMYRAWPILDIYGPVSNPALIWTSPAGGQIVFSGLNIASGDFVEVNTQQQTALTDADPARSVYQYLDFANTRWAGFEPGLTTVQFTTSFVAPPGHIVVSWADSSI